MMFNNNTPNNKREIFTTSINLPINTKINTYLGLPTSIGRSKARSFNYLIDKVITRLNTWKINHLSYVGITTLITVVSQAILTYVMSYFLLPKSLINKMDSLLARYWWGEKKIHWKKWDMLCKNKTEGGLGFKRLKDFNEAMLAKKVWRLYIEPQSLVDKVLKAKYSPKQDYLKVKIGINTSYLWRSLAHSIGIIRKGSCWTIGNGQQVNIWEDNWIPSQCGFKFLTQRSLEIRTIGVRDLINRKTNVGTKIC